MLLSSYQRLRRYCAGQGGDPLTDSTVNKRDLLMWLPAVSNQIEDYLNRSLETASYTEYFDIQCDSKIFYPKAIPIASITSVYADVQSLWAGGEYALSNYYTTFDSNGIVLETEEQFDARKALRIIYTGGLAAHATRSVYNIGTISGTFDVDKFVSGSLSSTIGIIKAVTATTITVEVLYGKFEIGETINEWDTEDAIGTSAATAVLTSASSLALCEGYPEIVTACEMQLRYLWKNKNTFEDGGVNKDGQSNRRSPSDGWKELQPEVKGLIDSYKRVSL